MPPRERDRRSAPRAPVNLGVKLRGLAPEAGGATISTESLNISVEGVYCTVPRFIPPLTRLALALVLPPDPAQGRYDDRVIQCEAVAVRSYPERESSSCVAYEVACYFTSMADEDRRALSDFLGVAGTVR